MTGSRLGSRLWWGFLPLVVLLWGVGALSTAALPGLVSSPLVTQVAVPFVAYARDVALAIAAGSVLAALIGGGARARSWALGWCAIALGLACAAVFTLQADVLAGQLAVEGLLPILTTTAIGQAIQIQIVCLVLAGILISLPWFLRQRWVASVALALIAIAVAALPIAGHAGVTSEHAIAGVSTGLHAIAISLWIGGLAATSALCLLEPDRAVAVLPKFSVIALICVVVAAETGLLTASLVVGALGDLVGSSYGSLVITKGVLLAWLIRLGWLQRRRAIDHLPQASVPITVARIAGVEFLAMATALAASVVLVRLGPPPIPSNGIAPLTLVALGVAVPMIVLQIWPRGWRISNALPEAAMVVFLLVIVEVGGVGLLRTALGPTGLLLELALLILAGWCAISAARNSATAVWLGVLGLPSALIANLWLGDAISWRMSAVAAVSGVALLLVWWQVGRRRRALTDVAVSVS